MRVVIEFGKRKFECVPCGPKCSFSRKDGKRPLRYDSNGEAWEECHCSKRCYCPTWFQPGNSVMLDGCGLREIKGGGK